MPPDQQSSIFDDKLVKIFNTLIYCLDPSYKSELESESIKIDLPTLNAYFKSNGEEIRVISGAADAGAGEVARDPEANLE